MHNPVMHRLITPRMPLLIVVIVLAGAGMRFTALLADARFHPDEAYFAGFARAAALHGEWLLPGDLDKPPLTIYASAISMALTAVRTTDAGILDLDVRTGEIAARLPSTLAGIVWIAVMYALTRALYPARRGAGAWAALLAACSPLAVGFGAAGFTDGGLLLALSAAVLTLVRGHWSWTAALLAIAVGCKFQAVYALPLIALVGLATLRFRQSVLVIVAGYGLGMAGVLAWDGLRMGGSSVSALAIERNDPARLIRPDEVMPRLMGWLAYGRGLFGAPTPLIVAASAVAGLCAPLRRRTGSHAIDLALMTFVIGYAAAHWLVAFNVYDRYLLLLLPALVPLSGRALARLQGWLTSRLPSGEAWVGVGVLALSVLAGGLGAGQGTLFYPVTGSSFERADGIDALAAFIDAQPPGTIVYDHWLGWELSYYLSAWTDKRRVYYPTPAALIAGALEQPDPAPRLFIVPLDVSAGVWLSALEAAGFVPQPVYNGVGGVVYRLLPP